MIKFGQNRKLNGVEKTKLVLTFLRMSIRTVRLTLNSRKSLKTKDFGSKTMKRSRMKHRFMPKTRPLLRRPWPSLCQRKQTKLTFFVRLASEIEMFAVIFNRKCTMNAPPS